MKTILLLLAFAIGIILPCGHVYSYLIKYLIMVMLFIAFSEINIDRNLVNLSVVTILIATLSIGFMAYLFVRPFGQQLALAAFITGITPTATAAPVITSLLRGKVEYVISSVLLTNCAIALILPFAIPAIAGENIEVSVYSILISTMYVIFFPFVASQIIVFLSSKSKSYIIRNKNISFYIWLIVLYLAISKATYFIANELYAPKLVVVEIAIVSLIICLFNFTLGRYIGGKKFSQEASQSLGQKNTMFTIWISITFINPLVALGPTFYVLYHNLYNSYQLYEYNKKCKLNPAKGVSGENE